MAEIEIEQQALAMALFRHEHDAGARRVARRSKRDRRAVDADLAGGWTMQAEDRFEQFRAAGADESEEADDLSARHRRS